MFVNMARSLRVLNAARQADIGVPITFDESVRKAERLRTRADLFTPDTSASAPLS